MTSDPERHAKERADYIRTYIRRTQRFPNADRGPTLAEFRRIKRACLKCNGSQICRQHKPLARMVGAI